MPSLLARAFLAVVVLLVAHMLLIEYVNWRDLQYDDGDLEGLLWWVMAFMVLPIIAAIVIVTTSIVWLVARWKNSGE